MGRAPRTSRNGSTDDDASTDDDVGSTVVASSYDEVSSHDEVSCYGDGPLGGRPDRAALERLEALYRERYEPSVRVAHLLVGDRHRAEELTQDAFVRLLPKLSGTDNPAGYLRVILVNLCRDHGRRQAMAAKYPHEPQPNAPPPGIPETSSAVWIALQGLPERQRVAISLRYYADVPSDEIARILDVRPTTVRSLIHRGLAALKDAVPHD